MVLQRHRPQYNDRWFSTKELDTILRKVSVFVIVVVDDDVLLLFVALFGVYH